MRYDHLSPQYSYLMEKIEELEREIKRLNDDVIEAHEMCGECVKVAGLFNQLPWYKKMFYKFKL